MLKIVGSDEQKQELRRKMLKIVSRDEQKQDLRRKMLKIVGSDEQKQDLRQKMLKIVSRDEQKQDLRRKMLKIVRCVSATATDVRTSKLHWVDAFLYVHPRRLALTESVLRYKRKRDGALSPKMPIFTTQNANTMAKDRFDIKEKETMNLLTETMVIVDKETGVNYLYVGRGYGGGLTPLLDADGKPIITKDGYKK